jgi:hypothetical protein
MGASRTSSAEMSSFTKISSQIPLPRRSYTGYGMLLCLFILAMSLVTLLFNLTIHQTRVHQESSLHQTPSCDLQFMKAKKVVLVSHELSLSGEKSKYNLYCQEIQLDLFGEVERSGDSLSTKRTGLSYLGSDDMILPGSVCC